MESRLTDLEIRLTHQEAALEELTHTVLEQDRLIVDLRGELEYLKGLLKDLAPSAVGPASDETPPPHY